MVKTSDDVEIKDPYLLEITKFAETGLLEQDELGLENRTLHQVIDVQVIPFAPPVPSKYILNLEFGDTNGNGSYICEVNIIDEVSTKTRDIEEGSSRCARRESNGPLEFIENGGSIAKLLKLDDPKTQELAKIAVSQMTEKKEGKHTLKTISQARRVLIEEANTNYYYFTLHISTTEENIIDEVCEVTLEEVLSDPSSKTLQSLRCFSTERSSHEPEVVPVPPEDLPPSFMDDAIMASLAVIDSESLSKFQLRVVGVSLYYSALSVDSGTRDLKFKLGLASTLCIKNSEEEEEEAKFCSVDAKRDPSICSITLTQWPWVTDGYLFSDLLCNQSNYETIEEELETFTDEDSQSDEEVEEVGSNDVQARKSDGESEEGESEESSEVVEEPFVSETAGCTGCPTQLNPNTGDILKKANLALSVLESSVNGEKALSVLRVVKASSQVVSGTLYKLTVQLAETNCLRGENIEISKCQVDENGARHTCTVTLWDQPWLGPPKVKDPLCTEIGAEIESRSLETPLIGGPRQNKTLSPDDEDVKMVAEFALSRLDYFDDDSKKRVLVQIHEPKSYVVARSKTYLMNLEVAVVDCPENAGSDCPIPESGSHSCSVQVLAQARTDSYVPKRLVTSRCHPKQDKEIKDVPVDTQKATGDTRIADNDDSYIQSVAQFATSAVNDQINDNSRVKLVRVVRAHTQVVAGKRVTLDLEVGKFN